MIIVHPGYMGFVINDHDDTVGIEQLEQRLCVFNNLAIFMSP
jgi:hypothetical protein